MKLNKALLNKFIKSELRKRLRESADLDFTESDMESIGAGGFDFIPKEVEIDGMRVLDLNNLSDIEEARHKAKELGVSHFLFNNKKDELGRPQVHSSGYADQQIDSLDSALDPDDPALAADAARIGLSGVGNQKPLNKPSRMGGYDPSFEAHYDPDDRIGGEGLGRVDNLDHEIAKSELEDLLLDIGEYEPETEDIASLVDDIDLMGADGEGPAFDEDEVLNLEDELFDDAAKIERGERISESIISYFSPPKPAKKKIKTKFYRR